MDKKTYYFIGINGIGMSGLAEVLVHKGQTVLGSDYSPSLRVDHFKSLGINVFNTQEKHIESSDWIIVISSAIKEDNEELIAAKEKAVR